jgi:cardiolipin synthase A/B
MSSVFDAIYPHVGAIFGFALAFVLIARLMREKRQPSHTYAWLLVILLIPYLGVPLYLLLGGRKLKKLAARKRILAKPRTTSTAAWREVDPLPVHRQYGVSTEPPLLGNRCAFLGAGERAYAELMQQIEGAERSIDLMVFILARDEVGRAVVQALARRARAGVKVRLLLDALGSFPTRGGFLGELRAAGAEIARFMPMLPVQSRWSANLRNHRKIALFDGERAIVGGHNIAQEYMGPVPRADRWRDFAALIEGPAASALGEIFEADWAFANNRSVPEPTPVEQPVAVRSGSGERRAAPALAEDEDGGIHVMASGPDVEGDPLYDAILAMVQEADRQILLVTPYYIPDEVLQRTLMVKARAGREVKLVVPAHSNHPVTDFARNHYLRELRDAGVHVLLYTPGMMHGKVMSVDGRVGMTGSANLDLRSLFVNFEVGTFFYAPQDLASIDRWIEGVIADSVPFEQLHHEKPGFFRNLVEDLSRLLAPVL